MIISWDICVFFSLREKAHRDVTEIISKVALFDVDDLTYVLMVGFLSKTENFSHI